VTEPPLWRRRRIARELALLRRMEPEQRKTVNQDSEWRTRIMGTTVIGKDSTGSAAWANVPAGLYGSTLASYESLGMQSYNNGPERERMVFNFQLDGQTDPETGDPIALKLYMNLVLSGKSSLAKLLADLGVSWKAGEAFDLDTVVGKRCQAVVKIVDGPNGPRPQITDILPPKAVAAPTSVQAEPVASGADICKVEGCDKTADYYTARGTPLCKNHGPEDL
jgi:hypothetical protein